MTPLSLATERLGSFHHHPFYGKVLLATLVAYTPSRGWYRALASNYRDLVLVTVSLR